MTTPTTAATGQTLPAGTIAAFATLGGATVAVTDDLAWRCLGCGNNGRYAFREGAVDRANTHAGTCRSIPLPTT